MTAGGLCIPVDTWSELPNDQRVEYDDPVELAAVLAQLRRMPRLVSGTEALRLRDQLALVAQGRAFLLQGGDCVEPFDATEEQISAKARLLLQMTMILMYETGLPVAKVARIAGQYTKPRSKPTDGSYNSYRGPGINSPERSPAARRHDPQRLLRMYNNSAWVLNYLRLLMGEGGFADLRQVHAWNPAFVRGSLEGQRYDATARDIDKVLAFVAACNQSSTPDSTFRHADLFVSHEAFSGPYESALVRVDDIAGGVFGSSGHMLWVGDRTRRIDGLHVELLSRIANPIGVKVGPSMTVEELLQLCDKLNPENIPGRLTLYARMGADKIRQLLPRLIAAVQEAGYIVVWACDPMHGNTIEDEVTGLKTRRFDAVVEETRGFFEVCLAAGAWPGGLHVELTGEDVTECLGGSLQPVYDLSGRYETGCDPRLNTQQSLELAFLVAEMLQGAR